jgi:DNA/RNA endonuclease G (NUC1)
MEKEITRYAIKVKKYICDDGNMNKIGEEIIETDSASLVNFPKNSLFSPDTNIAIELEFVEERKYKESSFNKGMIERI